MSHAVIKCSQATMRNMQQHYQSYLQTKQPPGSLFTAKITGCTITAYQSRKVLFQGKQAEAEASLWREHPSTPSSHISSPSTTLDTDLSKLSMIGSDEVGTGDYFGPMVVTAAFISTQQLSHMQVLGLKDSKKLSDAHIQQLAEQIKPYITHHTLTLSNQKYNELKEQNLNQGKMKALMHNQALGLLLDKMQGVSYDGILIDQFCQPTVYFKYLQGQKHIIKDDVYFRTKAESVHLSVAAASIIARQRFLEVMQQLSASLELTLPKGAGATVDETAAQLIDTYGEAILQHYAKVHFANTNKAKARFHHN